MMVLLSIFINMYTLIAIPQNITVDLFHPQIPWFRSSEYIMQEHSVGEKDCPDWKNLYEDIEITERPIVSEEEKGCVRKFILDPIKAGKYLIPPAIIKGEGKEWRTSAFVLDVRDPTEKEKEEIQNTAGIIEPEIGLSYTKFIIGGFILALVIAIIAGLIYSYKKHFVKGKTDAEKIEFPWEKAFRRLKDLKTKDLPSQGLYEPYYVQLTWILRYYIEDRFNIHAPEQTTQEFIETTMKEKVLTTEQQKLLYSFLNHCDKVKFAQFIPTLEQMEAGYNLVWNFVVETQIKEQSQGNIKELKQQDNLSQ